MIRQTIVAIILFAACDPEGAVNVTQKEGGGYTVGFENCTRPAQELPLKSLYVHIAGSDKQAPPWCSLVRNDTSKPPIIGSWRYGEVVPGYTMEGCAPLRHTTTYEVQAHIAVALANSTIHIGADGTPRRTKGRCK